MKKFFLKHTKISGVIIALVSLPIYFLVITKVLVLLFFGQPQDSESCGMGGVLVLMIVLLSMGASLLLSIFSGVFATNYLNNNTEHWLR